MRIHNSYRLTPEAVAIIKKLAAKKGVSQAAILEMAVRDMDEKEKRK